MSVFVGMGSKVIKVAMWLTQSSYRWNSPLWFSGYTSLSVLATHPYYASLFSNPKLSVYHIIAYRV